MKNLLTKIKAYFTTRKIKAISPAKVRYTALHGNHPSVEEKIDGIRFLMYLGFNPQGKAKTVNTLLSRTVKNGAFVDKSLNYQHLANLSHDLQGTVLDGEVFAGSFENTVSINQSSPSLAASKQKNEKADFFVFDIPYYKGKDIRELPLRERRKFLLKAVEELNNPFVKVVPWYSNREHLDT